MWKMRKRHWIWLFKLTKSLEDPAVSTPIMINVDGFILTHTYELVENPRTGTC